MKTLVPSVKMKLAVHCAPSVSVCTPGWTAAVAAGAHVGAAFADDVVTAAPASPSRAQKTATMQLRRMAGLDDTGPPPGWVTNPFSPTPPLSPASPQVRQE